METKFIDFLNENRIIGKIKERKLYIDKEAIQKTVDAIIKSIEMNNYKLFLKLFREYEHHYSYESSGNIVVDDDKFEVNDIYNMINATCIYNRVDMFQYLNTCDEKSIEKNSEKKMSDRVIMNVLEKMVVEMNIKLTEYYLQHSEETDEFLFLNALQYFDTGKKQSYKPILPMITYFFKNDYGIQDADVERFIDIYDTYRGGKKVFSDIENCIETAFDGDDSKIHSFLSNKYLSESNLKLLFNKYFSQNFKDKYEYLFEFNYYTKSLTNKNEN